MAYGATPKQALPYPLASEKVADGNDHVRLLAQKLDDLVVMRFATQAALTTAVPAPVAGQTAWITADKVLQVYDGTGWQRVYPPTPNILTGSTIPTTLQGTAGDIYIQF